MANELVFVSANTSSRSKVKTGCGTCRTRKVKCDERKPHCEKCIKSGRRCDGYRSTFRNYTGDSASEVDGSAGISRSGTVGSRVLLQPALTGEPAQDIAVLSRYFSTKTLFDVDLDCDEDARRILEASLTDPAIRHAIASLISLRANLATTVGPAATIAQQYAGSSHDVGTQDYCTALKSVATNLSSQGPHAIKSALLCCQIFISIEQTRQNFAVMAQHMVQGLSIMREYRVRPSLDATGTTLLPSYHDHLSLLDVFLVKIFAAPCKFAEPPRSAPASDNGVSDYPTPPLEADAESPTQLRVIAPDPRTNLNRIAASLLAFLNKASLVRSVEEAHQLLPERMSLLDALQSWLSELHPCNASTKSTGPELLSLTFLRLFHRIMNVILLGVVFHSPSLVVELHKENSCLMEIAVGIDDRVKAFGQVKSL